MNCTAKIAISEILKLLGALNFYKDPECQIQGYGH